MIDPVYSGQDTTDGHFGHLGSFIEVPYRNMESGLQMTPHVDEHKSPQNSWLTKAHPGLSDRQLNKSWGPGSHWTARRQLSRSFAEVSSKQLF